MTKKAYLKKSQRKSTPRGEKSNGPTMDLTMSWSRKRSISIAGSQWNGIRVIGDKYEDVDRADAEGPGKLWK